MHFCHPYLMKELKDLDHFLSGMGVDRPAGACFLYVGSRIYCVCGWIFPDMKTFLGHVMDCQLDHHSKDGGHKWAESTDECMEWTISELRTIVRERFEVGRGGNRGCVSPSPTIISGEFPSDKDSHDDEPGVAKKMKVSSELSCSSCGIHDLGLTASNSICCICEDTLKSSHVNRDVHRKYSSLCENVELPRDLLCICCGEHDIGLTASEVPCNICGKVEDSLDTLIKHRTKVHHWSQTIHGENIRFDRPIHPIDKNLGLTLAFFCPIPGCKYNISALPGPDKDPIASARSSVAPARRYFSTFKLLKQHYAKVHASRSIKCPDCDRSFSTTTMLKTHRNDGPCAAAKIETPVEGAGSRIFKCDNCPSAYNSRESLITHCRRQNHPLPARFKKVARKNVVVDPATLKLTRLQGAARNQLPLAPTPSASHLSAALALSELANRPILRADIGVQTDIRVTTSVKKLSQPVAGFKDAASGARSKITAGTQTALSNRSRTRNADTCANITSTSAGNGYVNTQAVQTHGEFILKPKKRKREAMASQASQCRMSPEKKLRKSPSENKKTEMTQTLEIPDQGLSLDISSSLGCYPTLWPLVRNSNATQTSPRVSMARLLSKDDDDCEELSDLHPAFAGQHTEIPIHSLEPGKAQKSVGTSHLPDCAEGKEQSFHAGDESIGNNHLNVALDGLLQAVGALNDANDASCSPREGDRTELISNLDFTGGLVEHSASGRRSITKIGEIRQLSTETQTDFVEWKDIAHCLNWSSKDDDEEDRTNYHSDVTLAQVSSREESGLQLLSNMETQTNLPDHADLDLLLCTNNFTQTGLDDHLSLMSQLENSPPVQFTCTTETQTSLTGLMPPFEAFPRDGAAVETVDVELMTDLFPTI